MGLEEREREKKVIRIIGAIVNCVRAVTACASVNCFILESIDNG